MAYTKEFIVRNPARVLRAFGYIFEKHGNCKVDGHICKDGGKATKISFKPRAK